MALPISTLILVLPLSVLARYPYDDADDPSDADDDTRHHMGSRSTRRTVATFFMFGIGFFMAVICCAYLCIPFLRDLHKDERQRQVQRVESTPSRIECGSFDGSGAASGDSAGYDMGTNDAAGMARAVEPE